jgi:hypothetical protein
MVTRVDEPRKRRRREVAGDVATREEEKEF